MKNITLSHTTALSAIRDYRAGSRDTINFVNDCMLGNLTPNKKIDILVDEKKKCYKDKIFQRHYENNNLAWKSQIALTKNTSVISPEMTIISMASNLNFYSLALLVLEFCGNFSVSNNAEQGFISDIKPITTVKDIQKFLDAFTKNSKCIRGINNLREVLTFASDNSNSPMESRLFVKLCAPRNRGLYSSKELKLNSRVRLSESASKIAGQTIITPDISCAKKKVAIEYDSSQFHEETEQGQRDKRRRDALVSEGWKVFTFVPAQINNPETFDIIAMQILKCLKQNSRIRYKDFAERRQKAFACLR